MTPVRSPSALACFCCLLLSLRLGPKNNAEMVASLRSDIHDGIAEGAEEMRERAQRIQTMRESVAVHSCCLSRSDLI